MRDDRAHRYFGIDVGLVWDAVERGLPDLRRKVEAILQALGGATQP